MATCAQAEHVVPVLAAELPLLAARRDSLWPRSLQRCHLSLLWSCDPAQPAPLGCKASLASLPRSQSVTCLPFLLPPKVQGH